MLDYFGNIFCTPQEIKDLRDGLPVDKVLSTRKQNTLFSVLQFANRGIGQAEARNGDKLNMWSAYNGVTGYITSKKYSSVSDRANSMLFGSAANLIEEAGVLALSPEKVQRLSKVTSNYNFN